MESGHLSYQTLTNCILEYKPLGKQQSQKINLTHSIKVFLYLKKLMPFLVEFRHFNLQRAFLSKKLRDKHHQIQIQKNSQILQK